MRKRLDVLSAFSHNEGMDLRTYLDREGMTVSEFARRVGISHSNVLRWMSGAYRPSLAAMVAVEKETGGAVTARDFVPEVTVSQPEAAA